MSLAIAGKSCHGKGSGIDSVKNGLKKLGVQFTEEEAMRVVAAVKDFSLRHKRLLTDAEFRTIVATTIPSNVAGSRKASDSRLTTILSMKAMVLTAPHEPCNRRSRPKPVARP